MLQHAASTCCPPTSRADRSALASRRRSPRRLSGSRAPRSCRPRRPPPPPRVARASRPPDAASSAPSFATRNARAWTSSSISFAASGSASGWRDGHIPGARHRRHGVGEARLPGGHHERLAPGKQHGGLGDSSAGTIGPVVGDQDRCDGVHRGSYPSDARWITVGVVGVSGSASVSTRTSSSVPPILTTSPGASRHAERDPLAVHERAVRAALILEHDRLPVNPDRCVHAGHGLVRDDDVRSGATAERGGPATGCIAPVPGPFVTWRRIVGTKPGVGLEPTTPSLPWRCSTN